MTTFIGTAAGYIDLLTKVDGHLTAQGHASGASFTGVGNGRIRGPGGTVGGYIGVSATVLETITITFSSATAFSVSGSVTGALGSGTVGTDFTSSRVSFRIVAGSTAFASGDIFRLNMTPKWTRHRLSGLGNTGDGFSSTLTGAAELVDGDATGTAASTTAFPATATWQMSVDSEVRALRIQCGATAGRGPATFSLDWSNDGTSWTTLQTWTGVGSWAANEARIFAVSSPVARRWWRVNVTAGQSSTLELWELRACGDAAGTWPLDNNSAGVQAVWQSPGPDGATPAFHGVFTSVVPASDVWNWRVTGFRFWPDQASNPSLINVANAAPPKSLPLIKTLSIAYWLIVSGSRYVLLVRISGIYMAVYSGFILPYEAPADYPWPMAVAAPTEIDGLRWDSINGGFRNFYDPGTNSSGSSGPGGLSVMQPNGVWREFCNRNGGTGEGNGLTPSDTQRGGAWPYLGQHNSSVQQVARFRDCLDGTLAMFPVVLFVAPHTGFDGAVLGELDGAYCMSGFGNAAEALTVDGAVDVISWPNVFRTSRNNFGGIALD